MTYKVKIISLRTVWPRYSNGFFLVSPILCICIVTSYKNEVGIIFDTRLQNLRRLHYLGAHLTKVNTDMNLSLKTGRFNIYGACIIIRIIINYA